MLTHKIKSTQARIEALPVVKITLETPRYCRYATAATHWKNANCIYPFTLIHNGIPCIQRGEHAEQEAGTTAEHQLEAQPQQVSCYAIDRNGIV